MVYGYDHETTQLHHHNRNPAGKRLPNPKTVFQNV
jgi:hypothetical protein